jgi:hypothetical protein
MQDGEIMGYFSPRTYDPFERRPDGLFLTESFARLNPERPRHLRQWFLDNGVLDHRRFATGEDSSDYFDIEDYVAVVARERDDVRRVLFSIAVLSLTLAPPAGEGRPWDPRWHSRDGWSEDIAIEPGLPAAWQEPTRDNHLRLTAFLLNDYVERAMMPSVILGQVGSLPLDPVVIRRWTSVLAPIYLQLYEALRRVSEDKPGARGCRECHEIFLVLDGRRERFCSELERARFNQRTYRARQADRKQ